MIKTFIAIVVVTALAVAGTLWTVAAPRPLSAETFNGLAAPDLQNGAAIFHAGGCASCHGAVENADAEGDGEEGETAPVLLAGGRAIESEFGTFRVPNITQSEEHGIGGWTFSQFANAMLRGISPAGGHYYPAYPYGSYALMEIGDVNDLWGYMQTLPASDNEVGGHDLAFPYDQRWAVGLWKYLYMPDGYRGPAGDENDPQIARGRYLVEAVGHCAECHTPRDELGGLQASRWLAGADNPSGDGSIPNITPAGDIGGWSLDDLAYYFESGFTPDFDVVGGSMGDVQEGLAQISAEDRQAIAAYLRALPEIE